MALILLACILCLGANVFGQDPYDVVLEYIKNQTTVYPFEKMVFPTSGTSFGGFMNDINDVAGMSYGWQNKTGLYTRLSDWYPTILSSAKPTDFNAGCLLHAMDMYNAVTQPLWFNRTGDANDFDQLLASGYIVRDYSMTFAGTDPIEGPYHMAFRMNALLRLDVAPDPRWFNPGFLWNLRNADMVYSECGPEVTTIWECFFSPERGLMNSMATGIILTANMNLTVHFDNGNSFSTASSPNHATLAGVTIRPLPYYEPFCGVPIPLI